MPAHAENICAKFHRNSSTKYKDIESREKVVANGRTDGRTTDNTMLSPLTVGGGT